MGESRVDVREQAGDVPLQRLAHGAVGRPRGHPLQRRPVGGRGSRQERPQAVPLLGDARRPGRARERGRRPRCAARADPLEGAARAGTDVPRRLRGGADRQGRGDQGARGGGPPLRGVARPPGARPRGPPPEGAARPRPGLADRAAPDVRLYVGAPQVRAPADGRGCEGPPRLDGKRRAAGRPLRASASPLRLLQAALRAGHEPPDRLDEGVVRHGARPPRRTGGQPPRDDRGPGRAPLDPPPGPDGRRDGLALRPGPGALAVGRDRHHLAEGRGAGRARADARPDLPRGVALDPGGGAAPPPLRPARRAGPRAAQRASRRRGRPPAPRPLRGAHDGGPSRRDGRAAVGPPLLHASRLRGGRDQPLPRLRGARRAGRGGAPRRSLVGAGADRPLPGGRRGRDPQGHGEDGDLGALELPGGADLRGGRSRSGGDGAVLQGEREPAQGSRIRGAGPGGDPEARPRLGAPARPPLPLASESRRIPLAPGGRAPDVESRHGRGGAARGDDGQPRKLPRVRAARRRGCAEPVHDPEPPRLPGRRAGSAWRRSSRPRRSSSTSRRER